MESFTVSMLAFGGVDIASSNAGIASARRSRTHPRAMGEERRHLSTGYFLVAREVFRLSKAGRGRQRGLCRLQDGLAASAGASAYCAAKASEIHLARCLALEGAAHGIRVNTVNPDAVLRGSKSGRANGSQQRAASNKVTEDELEEVYRQRSMLKLSVYPRTSPRASISSRAITIIAFMYWLS